MRINKKACYSRLNKPGTPRLPGPPGDQFRAAISAPGARLGRTLGHVRARVRARRARKIIARYIRASSCASRWKQLERLFLFRSFFFLFPVVCVIKYSSLAVLPAAVGACWVQGRRLGLGFVCRTLLAQSLLAFFASDLISALEPFFF